MGTESSQTEQATNGQEAQANEPSGVAEALAMFRQEQAKNEPSEGNEETHQSQDNKGESQETETQGEENEASKSEAQKGEESESQESPFRLVDAEGKPVPLSLKVDDEEIALDISNPKDLNKLKTWAQLGRYGTRRNEELNQREESLKQAEEMLNQITGAIKDGRLVVNPSSSDKKVEPSEAEKALKTELAELEEIDDPELRKEREGRLKLQQEHELLKKEFSGLKELVTGKFVEEMKTTMDKEIQGLISDKYPYAKEKDVWDLLSVKENGKPKYATIEDAVKISHEEERSRVRSLIDKDPDLKQKSEEDKQTIISQYLKEKAEKEKAPVSAPSDTTADAKSGEIEVGEITGVSDAIAKWKQWHKGRKEASANI